MHVMYIPYEHSKQPEQILLAVWKLPDWLLTDYVHVLTSLGRCLTWFPLFTLFNDLYVSKEGGGYPKVFEKSFGECLDYLRISPKLPMKA